MSSKLLSICILSYNQADEIERLLDSLAPQITDELEIVIRDDSTNNETELLVQQYSDMFPIRYFRGEKGGIDKTIIFLTQEARGEFIWWMGDDDIVPDGVTKVLDTIKKNKDLTFIWANYQLISGSNLAINLSGDQFFADHNQLLELGGAGLGFISATILKRELALGGIEASRKHIGGEFVNLYLVLQVISQPGRYYYIQGPMVICHPATVDEIRQVVVKNDGRIENNAFEVFGINYSEIVREFSNSFRADSVRHTINKTFRQTWRGLLVASAGGWDTTKGKKIRMLRYFWMFPEAWLVFLLFLIPLPVNRFLYRIYKIFFSHGRWKFAK